MYAADLHIHSKYSRATSGDCDAPHLELWARYKGIELVGTGDFTHPGWRKELTEALEPAEEGLYRLKKECALSGEPVADPGDVRFVLSGEISTIYKKDGKTRKVHHVILLPGLEAAEELAHRLEAVGNVHSDGRPILGLDSRDLMEITMDCCPEAVFIPAHIWTPHFSLFGAFSCFSTLEECYGDMSPYIHALETGLSSDPPMNRRVGMLDAYTLVSNSDAHSPAKLGREANLLECDRNYPAMKRAIETGEGFYGTVEFFPEEGKYHLDGHRACDCCLEPEQTEALDGRCPVCGRKLTVGVLHRVEELADRREPISCPKPFESLMPLPELLGNCLGLGSGGKKVQAVYFEMLKRYGSEFFILRELPVEQMERDYGFGAGEALRRLRAGQVNRVAGYDGEYGHITVFQPHELEMLGGQLSLLDGLPSPARKKKALTAEARTPSPQEAQGASQAAPEGPFPLNAEQREAAQTDAPFVAVAAGPGTGKTRTLTERVAYLIEEKGVSPKEITAVTFTNQAAEEMKARLEKRLGEAGKARGLTIGTFHAIALSLLPKKPIVSREQAKALMEELLRERGDKLSSAQALSLVSAQKNGLEPTGLPAGLRAAYDERLHANGQRDLDDLLIEALDTDVIDMPAFRYLLVDEYQDLNALQRRLVAHWSAQGKSLFVIGDPDQSIYGFRGADAACFERLKADHPEGRFITLVENYRSTSAVLRNALAVIRHNPGGDRTLHANCPEGAKVRLVLADDPYSEGVFIAKEIGRMAGGVDMLAAHRRRNQRDTVRAFSDIAVLCRTRRQLEQIEFCLVHDSIPCVICGREAFWEDGKVRGMLGFFRALLEPTDAAALEDALKGLWKCPQPLIQRAQVALAQQGPAPEKLHNALDEFAPLRPWLESVDKLLPQLARAKPRKLLEALALRAELKTGPVEKLLNAAVFDSRMDAFLQAALLGEESDLRRRSAENYQSGAVRLSTFHGAKGLEFPVVFLAGVNKGDLPLERAESETDEGEERRLFFVGMTRAREELVISCGGEASPFLQELGGDAARQTARSYHATQKEEQLRLF